MKDNLKRIHFKGYIWMGENGQTGTVIYPYTPDEPQKVQGDWQERLNNISISHVIARMLNAANEALNTIPESKDVFSFDNITD